MESVLVNATDALLALDTSSFTDVVVDAITSSTAMTYLGISTKAWTTVLAVYMSVIFVFIIVLTMCCICCGCFEEPTTVPPTVQQRPPSIVVIPANPAPMTAPPPPATTTHTSPPSDVIIEEKQTVTRLPDGSVCTERTTIKSHSEKRRGSKRKQSAKEHSRRLRRASQKSCGRSSRENRSRRGSNHSVRSNRHVSFADEQPSALESNTGTYMNDDDDYIQ